jgi:hypothetical protein
LVFGIIIVLFVIIKAFIMSRELKEFSDLIDEQFDIAEIEEEGFWESILEMFI